MRNPFPIYKTWTKTEVENLLQYIKEENTSEEYHMRLYKEKWLNIR